MLNLQNSNTVKDTDTIRTMINEESIGRALEKLFSELPFKNEPSGLYKPLEYMIAIGGKRIRPRLCLLSYSLFKDEISDEILAPTAAIEVFHSFTLIHDDIMDNAPIRRGVPTVWKKWDENTAILSGDVMSIESYRLLSRTPAKYLPEVLTLFSDTAAYVCEGQQYDMEFEMKESVSMEEYIRMIGLKTAVLIACAAKIGAIVGGASAEDQAALYDYAWSLGLAFQIADDWLDTFGDPAVFGKSIGGDILNNKKTWLLTKTFEVVADKEREKLELLNAMTMPVDTPAQKQKKIEAVRNIYIESGASRAAQNEIRRLHAEALSHAERLSVSKVRREMLHRFAEGLLSRAK